MIKEYFDEQLGNDMDTSSGETRYNCPFCDETNHKLYIHTDTNSPRYGLWECKHCGQHGNFAGFIMRLQHISYKQAKDLAADYAVVLGDFKYNDEVTSEENLLLALDSIQEPNVSTKDILAEEHLKPTKFSPDFKSLITNWNTNEVQPYIEYCFKRGFTVDDIQRYNICYCPFTQVENDGEVIITVYKSLIFITYDLDGTPIYWNTRSIVPSKAKAKNAPEIEGHHSKNNTVFNLDKACKEPYLIIVEGVPDAITLGSPAVATFGKMVTDTQISQILGAISPETPIMVLLDMDAKKILIELARRISLRHPEVYMIKNPTNQDANSLGRQGIYEVIRDNKIKYTPESALMFGLS